MQRQHLRQQPRAPLDGSAQVCVWQQPTQLHHTAQQSRRRHLQQLRRTPTR